MKNPANPTISMSNFLLAYQQPLQALHIFLDKRITRIIQPPRKSTYCHILALHSPPPVSTSSSQPSIQSFQSLCSSFKIDSYYSTTILQTFSRLSATQRALLLTHQLQQLSSGTSYYHLIRQIILSRNNCIKQIKKAVDDLKQSIARISQLDDLCMLMVHLRILTLFLVEQIYGWNSSLDSLFEDRRRDVEYEYEGREVFEGICQDAEFLKTTILRKYLKFPKGFDPLLIRLGRKEGKERGRGNEMLIVNYDQEEIDRFSLLLIQLDSGMVNRLRNAEMTLIKYHSLKQEREREREERGDSMKREYEKDLIKNGKSFEAAMDNQEAKIRHKEQTSTTPHHSNQNKPPPETPSPSNPPNNQIQVQSQSITLPKVAITSQQTIRRSPGFISHRSDSRASISFKNFPSKQISLPSKYKSQQLNDTIQSKDNPEDMKPSQRRNHLMKKIRILNEQLKADMKTETEKYLRIVKKENVYCSQPKIKTTSRSLNALMKVVPSTIDQIPEKMYRKRKVSAKAQKFRILKDIYCDRVETDLEISLKIIRERAGQSLEIKRKGRSRHYQSSESEQSSESLNEILKLRQRVKSPPIKISILKNKKSQ